MTSISTAAEAARETARTTTGQFGAQEHSAPEADLQLSDWDAAEKRFQAAIDDTVTENYGEVADPDTYARAKWEEGDEPIPKDLVAAALDWGYLDGDGISALMNRAAARGNPTASQDAIDRDVDEVIWANYGTMGDIEVFNAAQDYYGEGPSSEEILNTALEMEHLDADGVLAMMRSAIRRAEKAPAGAPTGEAAK